MISFFSRGDTMKFLTFFLFFLCHQSLQAKTFIYCSEGSPSSFNPQVVTDGTSLNASMHTIYNRLVEFEYGTTQIIPALAKSWKISKDQKTYTFFLRKGVKFHKTSYFTPKRDFNANDVIFSIHRQMLKDHPYHKVGGGTYSYFNGMAMGSLIQSVKKLDDYRVQIVLSQPEAPFLANLAMGFMSILSEEYANWLRKEGRAEDLDRLPIGTGPFIFKKYVKDTLIRYVRNSEYWRPVAKIKKLVFTITPDASVRYQKLRVGECHLIIEPAPSDLEAMRLNKKIKIIQKPGHNISYVAMNTSREPFNKLMVRKAINHALNRQSYIKAIYLGKAMVATNPIPPTIWSYKEGLRDYEYNPEKAKKLLAQAGFPNGFKTEMWTLPVTRPYNPNGKKMGEMMQADLAKVGIQVKLVTYDWPTYLKKSREGKHQLIQFGWVSDNGDPDNFLSVLLGCESIKGGSNISFWCHKEFNRLIVEAKRNPVRSERVKLYIKAQEIFKDEVPWVTVAHAITFRAMRANVEGYKISPLGADIFSSVDLR